MAYPSNGNELVTLAEVKSTNNITLATWDTYISNLIPQIGRLIENYCRRRFIKATWTQWCSVDKELLTDNWPINNVIMIGVPYDVVKITDTNNIYNFGVIQTTSNNINLVPKFIASNTQTFATTEFLFSTYTTLGALKTAVEAALTGVTFEYQQNSTPITFANINTLTLRSTNGKTLSAGINFFDQTTSTSVGDVYRISENSDRLFLNPNFAQASHTMSSGNYVGPYTTGINNIDTGYTLDWYNETTLLLVYDSGYTTAEVPLDIKYIVCNIINDVMSMNDIMGSGVSKNIYRKEELGDYNYELDPNSHLSVIVGRYHDQLDIYRRKII